MFLCADVHWGTPRLHCGVGSGAVAVAGAGERGGHLESDRPTVATTGEGKAGHRVVLGYP
jgi:hypothetical protein